ncbi:hypothetical protein M427DRAFT_211223 [Gonapodya prolifera JEL478]|uniref:Uncharacterized protein n=1 Tax=Gonapodya prolifera (strain JEL478) TaxID=1344416 RepID=A0A139AP07_GONPJ|nr:hypothetical protein M427DRAFT_211223 [Gonapodya prolifera JEL478]|eukprot:KXS18466.1 hypothetical protein M427DRAFT_211223 [Gonapodya prolifera JEL478]
MTAAVQGHPDEEAAWSSDSELAARLFPELSSSFAPSSSTWPPQPKPQNSDDSEDEPEPIRELSFETSRSDSSHDFQSHSENVGGARAAEKREVPAAQVHSDVESGPSSDNELAARLFPQLSSSFAPSSSTRPQQSKTPVADSSDEEPEPVRELSFETSRSNSSRDFQSQSENAGEARAADKREISEPVTTKVAPQKPLWAAWDERPSLDKQEGAPQAMQPTGIPGVFHVAPLPGQRGTSARPAVPSKVFLPTNNSSSDFVTALQNASDMLNRLSIGEPTTRSSQKEVSESQPATGIGKPLSSVDYLSYKNVDARLFASRNSKSSTKHIRPPKTLPPPPPPSPPTTDRSGGTLVANNVQPSVWAPNSSVAATGTSKPPSSSPLVPLKTEPRGIVPVKTEPRGTTPNMEFRPPSFTGSNDYSGSTTYRMPGSYPASSSSTSLHNPHSQTQAERPLTRLIPLGRSVSEFSASSLSVPEPTNGLSDWESSGPLPNGVSDNMSREDATKTVQSLFAAVIQSDEAAQATEEFVSPEDLVCDLLPHQIKGVKWMAALEKSGPKGGILADVRIPVLSSYNRSSTLI